MNKKILDCTLRDGGHVNNADFGKEKIKGIIHGLVDAKIDYVELGFLRNGNFTEHQALYNNVKEIIPYLPEEQQNTKFTVMIRPDWYDITQLSESNSKIETIRFAFYYKDIKLLKEQCKVAKAKGYHNICNPVNIMGYTDEYLKKLIEQVNEIHPEQLTLVDTYGSMRIPNLQHIYEIIEKYLEKDIRVGLHLHENQSLAFGLAQKFLDLKKADRSIVIDGSLFGMGRVPGNLCIEVIAEYMNSIYKTCYDVDKLYFLIGKYIESIKQVFPWGYSPAYFITACLNMHRSYAEFLLKRKNLSLSDINEILKTIEPDMRSEFHGDYLEKKYQEYLSKIM